METETVTMEFDFDEFNSMVKPLIELGYFVEGHKPGLAEGCMAIFEHAEAGAMMYDWHLLRVDEVGNKFYIYTEMDKESAKKFKYKSVDVFREHEEKELKLERRKLITKLIVRTLIVGAIGFIAGALAANLI